MKRRHVKDNARRTVRDTQTADLFAPRAAPALAPTFAPAPTTSRALAPARSLDGVPWSALSRDYGLRTGSRPDELGRPVRVPGLFELYLLSDTNATWTRPLNRAEAQAFAEASTAHFASRPKYPNGRLIPVPGDGVYQARAGFGGMGAYVHGVVYSERGKLRVRVTGTASLLGVESAGFKTAALDGSWRLSFDPANLPAMFEEDTRYAGVVADLERGRSMKADRYARSYDGAIARGEVPLTPAIAHPGMTVHAHRGEQFDESVPLHKRALTVTRVEGDDVYVREVIDAKKRRDYGYPDGYVAPEYKLRNTEIYTNPDSQRTYRGATQADWMPTLYTAVVGARKANARVTRANAAEAQRVVAVLRAAGLQFEIDRPRDKVAGLKVSAPHPEWGISTVPVAYNNPTRSGFDEAAMRHALTAAIRALQARGATVRVDEEAGLASGVIHVVPGTLGAPQVARKRNDLATAQYAVLGLMGTGSAVALGRGMLAERRAKQLDRAVLAALAPWRLPGDVHLSPPEPGFNPSPRLAALAQANGLSTHYDTRKRELLAQAAAGDVHVARDVRGVPYLSLPGGPPLEVEFSRARRFKRNDVGGAQAAHAATPAAPVGPWAMAQVDDPVFGSMGAFVSETGAAEVYRWTGAAWELLRTGTWNLGRARLDGVDLPRPILAGLDRAVLASPHALTALKAARKALPNTSFHGTGTSLPTLGDGADIALRAMAAARCEATKSANVRPKTVADAQNRVREADVEVRKAKAALGAAKGAREQAAASKRVTAAQAKARTARARAELVSGAVATRARQVAGVAFRDVCPLGPVVPGSDCDRTLDALASVGPDVPCTVAPLPCPRRLTVDDLTAMRAGMLPIGPYETARPHAVGADPCCYYHPATQERLKLRRPIDHDHEPGSRAWQAAVAAAERTSPFAATWEACDADAREQVERGGVADASGQGSGGEMGLVRGFYEAARAGDGAQARELYWQMEREGIVREDFERLYSLDNAFLDMAHRQAHETGNFGFITWIHKVMAARGKPAFHPKKGEAGYDPAKDSWGPSRKGRR